MAKLFGEVINEALTPTDRLWLAISALDVVAHEFAPQVPHGMDEVIGVTYTDNRGIIHASFDYFYAQDEDRFLPSFERRIQTETRDARERHILDDDHTTTSLFRNGMSKQGGELEILMMARGVEGIISKMMIQAPDTAWWVSTKTKAE